MKAFKYILAASAAVALVGCSDDPSNALNGEGSVKLEVALNNDVRSRATSDELAAELGDSFLLWLYRTSGAQDQQGVIRKYEGLADLPADLTLKAGSYRMRAWAGDSVSASFDKRWFKGDAAFDVTAGAVSSVTLDCRIANTVVSIEYADGVLDNYEIDSIYVSHKRGALSFKGDTPARGYFMMPSTDKNLAWQFIAHRKKDDAVRTFSGTFENVKPAYEYKLKVVFTPNDPVNTEVGGAMVDIIVDTDEVPVYESVVVEAAPLIEGEGIASPLVTSEATFETSVYVTATSALKSVKVSSDDMGELVKTSTGQPITAFDTKLTNAGLISAINNSGIVWDDPKFTGMNLSITFKAPFTTNMQWGKEYRITIEATDAAGLTTTRTLVMQKTQDPVSLPAAPAADSPLLTPTSYTVEGDIVNELEPGAEIYGHVAEASVSRAGGWTSVKAEVSGSKYTIAFTGLKAGVDYHYYVTVGDYESPLVGFATINPQLPNNSFEDWQVSKAPYLIYPSGGDMFWDSGNHGSATMSKNVTVPDESIKHSGARSIKLNSQFVGIGKVGKFAAGNVFIGQYLATDGTDGVLGWGRPFKYSPTKVKGWYKYSPVAITDVASNAPAEYVKGERDRGIIYVALLDGTTDSEYPEFPVVIKTKSTQLFNKDGSNVIAYGEIVFTEASTGDSMQEFEIILDYKRPGVTPSFIMLTASASKGGDYFTGGNGSTLWLDDIELVY